MSADAATVLQNQNGRRARDYGNHKNPPDLATTPEQWIAEEKLMPAPCTHTNMSRTARHETNAGGVGIPVRLGTRRMGANVLRAARPSSADGSRRGGCHLIVFIKTWTEGEGRKDQEILTAAVNPHPRWPWSTPEQFVGRLAEANREASHRELMRRAPEVEVR